MKKISTLELARLTDFDRGTVGRRIDHLPFEPGPKRAKLYDSAIALRVLYGQAETGAVDETTGMSPQDALAVTRKKEIELGMEVTRGERWPCEDVEAIHESALSNVAGLLKSHEGKPLSAELIRDIFTELREVGAHLAKL